MKKIFSKLLLFFLITLFIVACSEVRKMPKSDYLLHDNTLIVNGKKSNAEELEIQLYQRPNSRLLGFKPRLQLYNLRRKNADSSYQAWLNKKPNRKENWTKLLSKKQVNRLGKSFLVSGYSSFFEKVGEPPVVYDTLKLSKSIKRLKKYYNNRGFFDATIVAKIDTLKNRKITLRYEIQSGQPYLLDSLFHDVNSFVVDSIFRVVQNDSYIKSGDIYKDENINLEAKRITSEMRNRGVHYFQENAIKFNFDSIDKKKKINLTTIISDQIVQQGDTLVEKPYQIFKISKVNVFTDRLAKESTKVIDSASYKGINFYSSGKLRFKPKRMYDFLFIEPGNLFSDKERVLTTQSLSRLNTFTFPRIQYVDPKDGSNTLIANIILSPIKKKNINFEADFSRSNIQEFGISGNMGVIFRNIFRGAELLSIGTRGSLGAASQLSNPNNVFFNVTEIGADLTLKIPRVLFPIKVNSIIKKEYFPQTSIILGAAKQVNIGLDKENYNGNFFYDWTTNKKRLNKYRFDLFNLQFIKNLNINNYYNVYRSAYNELNELAAAYNTNNNWIDGNGNLTLPGADGFINDALNGAFTLLTQNNSDYKRIASIAERKERLIENNLILSSSFLYNLNSKKGANDLEFYNIRAKIESAGNVIGMLAKIKDEPLNDNGKKTLFGVEYSQYLKAELEYVKHLHIRRFSVFAFRGFLGYAYPFGNSTSIPFNRSYFAGGSNDNRGWLAYSLGPGASVNINDFNEANLKIATNLEYRFNIFNKFNGALFVDAGNIWNYLDNVEDDKYIFKGLSSLKDVAIGTGLGIRYDFGFVILRGDLGFKTYNPAHEIKDRWLTDFNLGKSVINIGVNYPF